MKVAIEEFVGAHNWATRSLSKTVELYKTILSVYFYIWLLFNKNEITGRGRIVRFLLHIFSSPHADSRGRISIAKRNRTLNKSRNRQFLRAIQIEIEPPITCLPAKAL